MAQGNELEAWRYRLIDPEDDSVYLSVQYFTDNAINPCQQSTYNFMGKVVQEIKKMHEGVQPLKIFHFGGDEVASGEDFKNKLLSSLRLLLFVLLLSLLSLLVLILLFLINTLLSNTEYGNH